MKLALVLFLAARLMAAQTDMPTTDGICRTLRCLDLVAEENNQAKFEAAKRRAAADAKKHFDGKLLEFTQAWNDLTEEYSTKGTWNRKKAKAVIERFEQAVKDAGWIR